MPLTDAAVRSAKPKDKAYKLSDAAGLHLLVETTGSRLWRQAYRFGGKQKLISLGAYPAVGLADARIARDANNSPSPMSTLKANRADALRRIS